MATTFPDHPYLTGHFKPFGAELDANDLVVEGRLPEGLEGTFYRNGPDPQFAPHPQDTYHPFDGDGMVYAFRFAGGRVSMRNRWVRTPKFTAERAAGRRLHGVFGNPRFSEPGVDPADYDTANTHIWPHAGRLFALMEGKPPTEIDPDTLDTIGYETFGGAAAGPFTAHPKLDPETGELFAFGYGAKGPGSTAIRYNIVDRAGREATTAWIDQPYSSMMHDLVLTENHVVFACLPVTFSFERAMTGKPATAWEDDKPAWFGVMSRYGNGADLRWVEADPTFAFHFANAHERGGDIIVEVAGARRAPLMPDSEGRLPRHETTRQTLKRWIIARDGAGVREEQIDDMELQFPRIDDRRGARSYGKIYFNGSTSATAGRAEGFDSIAVFDIDRSERRSHHAEGAFYGEPVFVPRPGSSAEGDGWLLALAWDSRANESALEVFDARAVDDGPLARVHAPSRIPAGFHCHWRPA